ncbi:MAG: restriction endonuclease [Candidatus Acidiferrales bacterium]
MKRGPSHLARLIVSRIDISAPPASVTKWGAEICLDLGWHASTAEAFEAAERWAPHMLALLRRELDELCKFGRFAVYAFNSSSTDLVQGSAFIEPCDSEGLKTAKAKRAHFASYLGALRELTPRQFEALCTGVLNQLGVKEPVLTPYSADEGLDFYGRLDLERRLLPDVVFPGLQTQLGVWMIGQAKHYSVGKVSTPDIRNLVGAVTLAKGHAFGSSVVKYKDLTIRVCDPVFYLFFTTSSLSSDAWTLLERSGVVGMDGHMLSAYLAEQGIGLTQGAFDKAALISWLEAFGTFQKR